MELQCINSTFMEKLKLDKRYLPVDSGSEYSVTTSPSNQYFNMRRGKDNSVILRMNKLGEWMENVTRGIREHVKLGPKLTETLKGKLSLGARILQVGGVGKVFKKNFNVSNGERLLKASQCYLSTTAGPIAGLLFLSTDKIAFCSERSIKLSSRSGKLLKVHYKIVIPLGKVKRVNESENAKKPKQKYVQIVTKDDCEFWFMGFVNYQKAFKCLQQTTSQDSSLRSRY